MRWLIVLLIVLVPSEPPSSCRLPKFPPKLREHFPDHHYTALKVSKVSHIELHLCWTVGTVNIGGQFCWILFRYLHVLAVTNQNEQNLADIRGYRQKSRVSATHDCRTEVADTLMGAVLLPSDQDTQVGFMEAKVPGNEMHLSPSENGRSHACLSVSVRPGDLRPNTNRQKHHVMHKRPR